MISIPNYSLTQFWFKNFSTFKIDAPPNLKVHLKRKNFKKYVCAVGEVREAGIVHIRAGA